MNVYTVYVELTEKYLGTRRNIIPALLLLKKMPEIFYVHLGELEAALKLFSRYRIDSTLRDGDFYPNAEILISKLGERALPSWDEIRTKLLNNNEFESEFSIIFNEIGSFEFPDKHDLTPIITLGTLFVSFYRTYSVVEYPFLRVTDPNIDILLGAAISEMLSILAIEGCITQLFLAEKVWILYHEGEWFSPALTEVVRKLSSQHKDNVPDVR